MPPPTTTYIVFQAVADVVGLDDEIVGDTTLVGDLQADWIDVIDILLRIQRATGVRIAVADLVAHFRDGGPDADVISLITVGNLADLVAERALPLAA